MHVQRGDYFLLAYALSRNDIHSCHCEPLDEAKQSLTSLFRHCEATKWPWQSLPVTARDSMSRRGLYVKPTRRQLRDCFASLAMTFRRKCHCEGLDVPKQSLSKASEGGRRDPFVACAPRNDKRENPRNDTSFFRHCEAAQRPWQSLRRLKDEIASLTLAMTFRRKCHCEGLDVPKGSLCKAYKEATTRLLR